MPSFFPLFVDSEWMPLKAVLLHLPSKEVEGPINPGDVLFTQRVSHEGLVKELNGLARTYRALGIRVFFIETNSAESPNGYLYNLMYVRDIFFPTPFGAVLSSMSREIRRPENKVAGDTLGGMGANIRAGVSLPGTFEGADALWVGKNLVAIGVGKRTNMDGFLQVRQALLPFGVRCVMLPAPGQALHLLGAIQFVSHDAAAVRHEIVGPGVLCFLRRHSINIIKIPESDEVRAMHAMNIVTIAPGSVIMHDECPETERILRRRGIRIISKVRARQLCAGGGGIACATGILARQPSFC